MHTMPPQIKPARARRNHSRRKSKSLSNTALLDYLYSNINHLANTERKFVAYLIRAREKRSLQLLHIDNVRAMCLIARCHNITLPAPYDTKLDRLGIRRRAALRRYINKGEWLRARTQICFTSTTSI